MAINNVLVASLTRIAFILTGQIRKNLKRGKYPDEIERGIIVGHPKTRGNSGNVQIIFTAPQSRAFEEGSGIHGPEGKKYEIKPKDAGALAFEWDKTPRGPGPKYIGQVDDGKMLFRFVEHPGIKPRPYILPALMTKKDEMRRALGSEFITLIGRGQAKRVMLT